MQNFLKISVLTVLTIGDDHQGSHCGSTVDPRGINTGGMSTRGRSLPWGLRGVDFRPLLRPWDYEIRDQRPQITIIPNGEGLG